MPFIAGDSVGILYSQKNKQGDWTVGIHNGAFLLEGTKRYHIKHSGNTSNPCSISPNTVYFYYDRNDYLDEYDNIINGESKIKNTDYIYLLTSIYKTNIPNSNITKNPAIAFASRVRKGAKYVVHNGRFSRFEVKDNTGNILKIYRDYSEFRKVYPTCDDLKNLNGTLFYVHYNIKKASSPGRYEAFQEGPLGAEIYNILNLSK